MTAIDSYFADEHLLFFLHLLNVLHLAISQRGHRNISAIGVYSLKKLIVQHATSQARVANSWSSTFQPLAKFPTFCLLLSLSRTQPAFDHSNRLRLLSSTD